ncbi:YKOF-related protein [Leucobacter luti]|uniref:Ykof family thiamine-binding protein n=1 Tax=Leucobacter luti TaxID=340320 RepID=UPI0010E28078|nr:Ykof family thiamine-binding protein [Leucobacter luti]MCW2287462.1 uncharacterized protein YqgV (UPF0045/DUF77 family) [Leucobacter luti]TCK41684.1 YKOF-related protein [Leucobacter luti]
MTQTPAAAATADTDVVSPAPMTPSQYGVGARFTLSVYDSDYVRIILEALSAADASELTIETTDISTFVGGSEQRVLEFLRDVITTAARSGAHLSAGILLSRGCPGELACELPAGVAALGAAPIALAPAGVRARAHWSLYPLLDGGSTGDHMTPIYAAIADAKTAGVYSGSDHFATRLDGDLAELLEVAANGWIGVGGVVQHVTTHLTVSLNSPTKISDIG